MGSPEDKERHYKNRQNRERDKLKRDLKREKKLQEYQDPFDDDTVFYKKKLIEREK